MEKMLFETKSGNLYEVLQSGAGFGYKSFVVEIWNKDENKWMKCGIRFKVQDNVDDEKEIIKYAKEIAENSIFED